jgi:cyclopropane-fatty-acyl-phospholipid synthase
VFQHGNGLVFHMQAARRRDAAPLTRDYIAEETRRLRERETNQPHLQAS